MQPDISGEEATEYGEMYRLVDGSFEQISYVKRLYPEE